MTEQLGTHSATLDKQIQKTTKSSWGYEVQQFSARLDLLLQMRNVPSDRSTLQPFLNKFLSPTLKKASQAQQIYTQRYVHAGILRSQGEQSNSHSLMKTQGNLGELGNLCELGNLWEHGNLWELGKLWKPSGVSQAWDPGKLCHVEAANIENHTQ